MFVTEKAFGEVSTPVKVKLSWAIREGAKLRPKCERAMFRNGGSCAIGAAYEALGGDPRLIEHIESGQSPFGPTLAEINRLIEARCGHIDEMWFGAIVRMNDGACMSREAIANFLEAHGL